MYTRDAYSKKSTFVIIQQVKGGKSTSELDGCLKFKKTTQYW